VMGGTGRDANAEERMDTRAVHREKKSARSREIRVICGGEARNTRGYGRGVQGPHAPSVVTPPPWGGIDHGQPPNDGQDPGVRNTSPMMQRGTK
jgi:hypothetical protein